MLNSRIEVRKAAILRHVWTLSDKERRWLDKYFVKRTTGYGMLMHLDENLHDHCGVFWYENIPYEVCWIQCSKDMMYDRSNATFLLSFRWHEDTNTALVLVKEPKDLSLAELANIKEI